MAHVSCWYQTGLPTKMIDILVSDVENLKPNDFLVKSKVIDDENFKEGIVAEKIRNSKHAWIPSSHWIGGFLWYYVDRINRENFLYDISGYDFNSIQYAEYSEGNYYKTHVDQDISSITKPDEKVRKLSFSLQLSSGNDYSGGDVKFINTDGSTFNAPRNRGCIIVFDSRTQHEVTPIKSGIRKSLVGWIVGPRWV